MLLFLAHKAVVFYHPFIEMQVDVDEEVSIVLDSSEMIPQGVVFCL